MKKNYEETNANDVEPAFRKFDKDNSGAIDKAELKQLMSDLGVQLTEDAVKVAMKDLDMNHDGVIDLEEFQRWYFTGMKSYSPGRRTLLKVGGRANQLLDAVKEEARNSLLTQELKYKHNKVSFGFNKPADPHTQIHAKVNIGGSDNEKLSNELHTKYAHTFTFTAAKKKYLVEY